MIKLIYFNSTEETYTTTALTNASKEINYRIYQYFLNMDETIFNLI